MATGDQQTEQEPNKTRGWDYSNHPLKAGGMQVFLVVVGCILLLVLSILLLWWIGVSLRGAGTGP